MIGFSLRNGLPILGVGDAVAAAAPIGLFFGRLANFINAELWGRPSTAPWAVVFPGEAAQTCPADWVGPCARHPSQLYEAGLEGLVLFAVLALAIRAGALARPGRVFGLLLVGYALARMSVERFRQADSQFVTLGQPARPCPAPRCRLGPDDGPDPVAADAAGRRDPARAGGAACVTDLGALIRRRIDAAGPMRLDAYMALCLSHPALGYYATRDPLGAAGDFITAPEISQMFGELIGAWAAQVWADQGRPDRFVLAELGPGRGTLMRDALRAGAALPGFLRRRAALAGRDQPRAARPPGRGARPPSRRAGSTESEDLPDGPLIVLANEFFDALPIRQVQRADASGASGWS